MAQRGLSHRLQCGNPIGAGLSLGCYFPSSSVLMARESVERWLNTRAPASVWETQNKLLAWDFCPAQSHPPALASFGEGTSRWKILLSRPLFSYNFAMKHILVMIIIRNSYYFAFWAKPKMSDCSNFCESSGLEMLSHCGFILHFSDY